MIYEQNINVCALKHSISKCVYLFYLHFILIELFHAGGKKARQYLFLILVLGDSLLGT